MTVCPDAADLWHNSRGGYRAQYYVDADLGDEANAHACEVLASTAERLIRDHPNGACLFRHGPPANRKKRRKLRRPYLANLKTAVEELRVSVYHRETRLWLHEGLWQHQCRKADRCLHVRRWKDNAHAAELAEHARRTELGQWLKKHDRLTELGRLVKTDLDFKKYERLKKLGQKWAPLTPWDETDLELKGQWLDQNGKADDKSPKPDRAMELYRFGYT